ncbi:MULTISPECIES: isoprenylcysteine carboxylmethyltransferase family protein [unclassified Chryseobacterium]|uniref:methyltransferase family protein n=1 Tax=unclassified Chryseobacterium TaxID=2593645 RepID=UPI002269EBB9|nr:MULTISPECIES: isoprenylcysteine carboxylmethyltransferase family protein [unclassified Chryseobacterium]
MTDFLRFFIPLYFILFFTIAFFRASFIVAKRIGKNPNVLPKDDSAYGLIGRYFKLCLLGLFLYTILLFLFSDDLFQLYLIHFLDIKILKYVGIFLMILSFIWVVIAQIHMKNSWRIGIDEESRTELITSGLFKFSRNPIFLGMIVSLIGFFMILPTMISLLFLILGIVLIQIQIRLEEVFLLKQHGENYVDYENRVRRLL